MSQHSSRQPNDSRPSRPARSRDGDAHSPAAGRQGGRQASPSRPSRDDARGEDSRTSRNDTRGANTRPPRAGGEVNSRPSRGGRDADSRPSQRNAAEGPKRSRAADGNSSRPAGGRGPSSASSSRGSASARPAGGSPRSRDEYPRQGEPRGGRDARVERENGSGRPTRNAGAAPRQAAPEAGAGSKERYPNAEFARREGMLEGLPAVMVVNRSLKGYAFRKEFPWCLRLAVAYRADETSGLPLPKEARVMEAFEQNLFGLLKKHVNGHYVGHTDWSGIREFMFYVDEGSEAEDPLNEFAERQKRELELSLSSDPRWELSTHYFDYRD